MHETGSAGGVFASGRTLVTTLERGMDLQAEIERLVLAHSMALCRVDGLGSLQSAHMAYYDQAAKDDLEISFKEPMMLVALFGTALRAGDEVETHCHLVVADESGKSYGGDLSPGCVAFSCELVLTELIGPAAARRADEATGLVHLRFGS